MPSPTVTQCSDYYIYQFTDKYISPIACKYNIHPNVVTVFNIVLNIAFFVYFQTISNPNKYHVLIMLLTYAFLYILDGSIARTCDKSTNFGANLDTLSDKLFMIVNIIMVYELIKQHKQCKKYMMFFIFYIVVLCSCPIINAIFKIYSQIDTSVKVKKLDVCLPFIHDNTFVLYFVGWLVTYNLLL